MMQKALHISAHALSILLHPLFIPTYCIASIFMYAGSKWEYILIISSLSLFFTAFTPLLEFYLLKRKGKISSLEMSDRKERLLPYLISILIMIIWSGFMYATEMPVYIIAIFVLAAVLIAVVAVINHWWKISIHLTAFGAYVGTMAIATHKSSDITIFPAMLLIALLLMFARIYLKAHTALQVVVGFLLGLIPSSVMLYMFLLK